MLKYRVGSTITYKAFGGVVRNVVVENKERDIKNGRPGFDGHMEYKKSAGVWGYDDQIVHVVRY